MDIQTIIKTTIYGGHVSFELNQTPEVENSKLYELEIKGDPDDFTWEDGNVYISITPEEAARMIKVLQSIIKFQK